jgi:twinkle protein
VKERYDIAEVKAALSSRIDDLCKEFLSNGKRAGSMWHVGSPENEAGDSLKIHLSGSKQGVGYFNRENKGVGPLDLFMRSQGITDFATGLAAAAKWAGVKPMADKPNVYEKFKRVNQALVAFKVEPPRCDYPRVKPGSRAFVYLTEERAVSPAALELGDVREGRAFMPKHNAEVDCWIVPVWDPRGKELLNVKYHAVDPVWNEPKQRNEKDVRAHKYCDYHLIGQQLIEPDDERPLIICEGEIDWLTCLSENLKAVSVPFGAKSDNPDTGEVNKGNRWLENDFEFLESQGSVIVCFDHDAEGRNGAETVLRRLPGGLVKLRADIVTVWPAAPEKSDINDLYRAQDPMYIHELFASAQEVQPGALGRISDWRDKIFAKIFREEGDLEGYEVHGLGEHFRIRMGEWSIITGYEKCGKTTWLSHQIVHLASQGPRACIATLESLPWKTYKNMVQQTLGVSRPRKAPDYQEDDVELFDRAVTWLDDRVYCFRQIGFVSLDEILELFAYTARRYGCRLFVIDNLMMVRTSRERGQSEYDEQKDISQRLKHFCEEYECHVFLVAHAKKVQDEKTQFRKPPRPQDVKGAGELVNLAFNIISIHLNDEKLAKVRDLWERKRGLEQMPDYKKRAMPDWEEQIENIEKALDLLEDVHDSTFYVLGQREAESEQPKPKRNLWFYHGAKQLWDEPRRVVERYVK